MITVSPDLEQKFLDKILHVLEYGETRFIRSTRTQKIRSYDKQTNHFTTRTIVTTELEKTERLPTPMYIYQLVAKSLELQTAITVLEQNGYIVTNPTADNETEESQGLSDEAVTEIKAKLLNLSVEDLKQLVTDD